MSISADDLAPQLKRKLAPLYTVFGDEPLLVIEAADRIRACAREQGYAEREVLIAEQHFDWSRLRLSGVSQSLFASLRILELRVPSGKPGVDGGKALQEFSANLPPDTVTLIEMGEIDWRSRKSAWFLALESAGTMVEAAAVKRDRLPTWIAGRLRMQQQSADEATLEFIAGKVEGNLLAAFQEVQKLGLLFPAGPLSFEQVKDAVLDVARFDVFDLGEVVLSGDAARLARTLDGLDGEGVAPPLVLWAMSEEIRVAGRVLAAMENGLPLQQALRDLRIWGPRQNLL
ncbi:MAG: DNA polymerase III subunit delta, partial [Betaproteobacteria bacterium]|nr:DNA polymerase III subunit delta [Betaproteobacteria bacterium]